MVVCELLDQKHVELFGVYFLKDLQLFGVHDDQKCVVVYGVHNQCDVAFCDPYSETSQLFCFSVFCALCCQNLLVALALVFSLSQEPPLVQCLARPWKSLLCHCWD